MIRNLIQPIHIILSLFMLFSSLSVIAQSEEKSELRDPFRKGMWISGLSGHVTSGHVTDRLTNSLATENSFEFISESGYFFKDNLVLGWTISGNGSVNTGNSESSELALGIVGRGYFSKKEGIGALFGETTLQYINISSKYTTLNSPIPLNEKILGSGFGFTLGLGFTYLVVNSIGFDFRMRYKGIWLDAERTNQIDDLEKSIDSYVSQVSFTFGFTIFINEFFF